MIGRTLGHYRLLEQIGAGGMGVVYRARDQRLERDVALKVLPPGTLGNEAVRKRFRHEALALSQLNHPNIATVHDFDTQDGIDFLVLEHIDGETLDRRLGRGPLVEREVAKLGAQLAAGLEAAHQRGVVHRDLKPANLRVTPDGRLKVLDFGLARLLQPLPDRDTLASLTETQTIVGTLPYMAPEILAGEKADPRSDLYSAGAVLYEMATGRRAFPQEGAAQLVYAILNEAPEPPTAVNRRLSPALESAVLKALEKDPELRYQSARDLRVDLERLGAPSVKLPSRPLPRPPSLTVPKWAIVAAALVGAIAMAWVLNPYSIRDRLGGKATGPANSLAVLPLVNLSGDPQQEYFADGMTEELITSLTKVSALIVISMSSVKGMRGQERPLNEIGRALQVALILRGSVTRSADRVRVNAQLIEAATNRNLWAESYERSLSDVLALQNEVALAIAREIQVKLSPQEEARLAGARAIDPQAHQAYLLGRYELARLTSEGTQRAIGHFERAIGIDPGYAPAYAALAEAYYYLSNWYLPPHQAMPLVRANAAKALERDGDLAIAHTMLAVVKAQYEFEWAEAMTTLRRAIQLNPGDATAHHWLGYVMMELGHFDEAEREFQKAVELDPLTIGTQWHATWPSFYRGDYPRTVSSLKKLLAKDASDWSTYSLLGETYEQMGDYNQAIVELRKALALGGNPWVLAAIGRTQARAGRRDSAMAVLRQLDHLAQGTYVSPYGAASIHAALGDTDRAFGLLERALSEHSEDIVLMKVDPRLEALRTDKRFAELVRRIGLADS